MNEFIVWDNESEIFIDETKCILADGTLFRNEKDFANEISDDLSMFFDIGLKDINGKNIYADSSIVEFKHKTLVDKVIGYFTFINDEYLRYEIKILKINPAVKNKDNFVFAKSLFSDIKIIDTIQENKLGLIK